MKDRPTKTFPSDVEETRQEFENWRSNHTGRKRIPEDLWTKAAALARRHGVCLTAQALRLDYPKLKRLMGDTGGVVKEGPRFVEVLGNAGNPCECVVEMESGRARMRIEFKGSVPDVAEWSRAFWSERS